MSEERVSEEMVAAANDAARRVTLVPCGVSTADAEMILLWAALDPAFRAALTDPRAEAAIRLAEAVVARNRTVEYDLAIAAYRSARALGMGELTDAEIAERIADAKTAGPERFRDWDDVRQSLVPPSSATEGEP